MNKKILILTISAIILASIVLGAFDTLVVPTSANVKITLISQEPDPVQPGEYVDIRFMIENIGSETAEDIIFEVIERYPFSLRPGDSSQKSLGSIQGRQKDEKGVIVLYKIKIDENAVEGTSYLDVRYKFGETTSKWRTVKDSFPIRIRARDLLLSLESIKSTPELVSPGQEFELSFILKNYGASLIRDIKIKLELAAASIPVAPSSSNAEKQVYQVASGEQKTMNFNLIALPDAEGNIYKIPVNISYTDETGTFYAKNDVISVKIASPPNLLLTVDSSEIKGEIKSGKIVIKITNRGLTNIKLLSAKVLENKEIIPLGEPEIYVGNIDSDDYETVEFNIKTTSYKKTVKLPIQLTYMDATNKKYQEEAVIELKTNSIGKIAFIIKKLFSGVITMILIVAVGFGGYWFYKRIKRKRKRQG